MSGVPDVARIAGVLSPDEVSIQVGDKRFQGWKTVHITRSCESIPNSWAVTASTQFMQGEALAATRAGQACNIYIGADLVITGWIDRRTIVANPRAHDVQLTGRGITRNLVDCSADLLRDPALSSGAISAPNVLDLARRLAKSFKITVRSAVEDLGLPIPALVIGLGETPYSVIESAARYAGYLVYEDAKGQLVLDRVGTKQHSSGFAMPGNIEAIHAERSVDQRYSDYTVVWVTIDQLKDLSTLANKRAEPTNGPDKTLGEYRPKIIVSEQLTPAFDLGQRRADWEMARRLGRAQAANITTDSWRDSKGLLWQPNMLAHLDAPRADVVNATWIIGTVTYRKDQSGTHCDLVMMPPDAFEPEPNPLSLFDRELAETPKVAQSPAPPTTSTALTGPGHPA
jgi:prophage tail gpP-like protein